jgi:hypothetical protein
MNWEAISAVGESIGGIAVIASLIYLGLQTRSNAKATEGLVRRQIADSSQLAYLTAVESPEFSSLVTRALMSNSELESDERSQMIRFINAIFLNFEVAYHQYESGLYDEWETVLTRRVQTMFKRSKFVREWWEESKSEQFSKSFSAAVDELVSEVAT